VELSNQKKSNNTSLINDVSRQYKHYQLFEKCAELADISDVKAMLSAYRHPVRKLKVTLTTFV